MPRSLSGLRTITNYSKELGNDNFYLVGVGVVGCVQRYDCNVVSTAWRVVYAQAHNNRDLHAYCQGQREGDRDRGWFRVGGNCEMSEAKWLTIVYVLAMVVLVLDIFYWRVG